MQVDTAMAKKTLHSMDTETGAVTPANFVYGRFFYFTCDNIDINNSKLDMMERIHFMQHRWQDGKAALKMT